MSRALKPIIEAPKNVWGLFLCLLINAGENIEAKSLCLDFFYEKIVF